MARRFPIPTPEILAWADAHKRRHGSWPKMTSGTVEAGPLGLNWRAVDNALSIGLRGLPGGSSLAKLLAERRGVRNVRALPPLTEAGILRWADAHHGRTGQWPTEDAGAIRDRGGETWGNVNAALPAG